MRGHDRELEHNRDEHEKLFDMLAPLRTMPAAVQALASDFRSYMSAQTASQNARAQLQETRDGNVRYLVLALITLFVMCAGLGATLISVLAAH